MATGFRVSTNASAMKTYRAFSAAQSKLEQSIERLSSGLRINKSSDDTEGAIHRPAQSAMTRASAL